mmetsp:Transcript_5878/g.14029  ORF Transcript_5878/g.14029 Transcript_5878/m.14029 type:complete len:225 (+) Transcript_5878:309-983(+)
MRLQQLGNHFDGWLDRQDPAPTRLPKNADKVRSSILADSALHLCITIGYEVVARPADVCQLFRPRKTEQFVQVAKNWFQDIHGRSRHSSTEIGERPSHTHTHLRVPNGALIDVLHTIKEVSGYGLCCSRLQCEVTKLLAISCYIANRPHCLFHQAGIARGYQRHKGLYTSAVHNSLCLATRSSCNIRQSPCRFQLQSRMSIFVEVGHVDWYQPFVNSVLDGRVL